MTIQLDWEQKTAVHLTTLKGALRNYKVTFIIWESCEAVNSKTGESQNFHYWEGQKMIAKGAVLYIMYMYKLLNNQTPTEFLSSPFM